MEKAKAKSVNEQNNEFQCPVLWQTKHFMTLAAKRHGENFNGRHPVKPTHTQREEEREIAREREREKHT